MTARSVPEVDDLRAAQTHRVSGQARSEEDARAHGYRDGEEERGEKSEDRSTHLRDSRAPRPSIALGLSP